MIFKRQSRLFVGVSMIGLLLGSPVSAQVTTAGPAQATNVSATPPSQPWPQEVSDIPADPAIRFGLLPNGVRYAIMQNKTPAGKASLWVRIDAGSLAENENQLGLAHFMEHMAFNGTEEIPENELIHRLQRLGLQFGADLNAGTSFDQTFYRLDMPHNDNESLDTGLHMLRQQISAAIMDPKAIDDERGVVQGEDRTRDSVQAVVSRKHFDAMGAGTLLPKRQPIGDMKIIQTAPRERFVEYYNRYYRPSRTTVIAVGDFDVDAMEGKIKTQFGNWQPKSPDGPEPQLGTPIKRGLEAYADIDKSLAPRVSIIWTRAPELLPDTVANRKKDVIRSIALAVLNRRMIETSRTDTPPFLDASAADGELFRGLRLTTISAQFVPEKWKASLAAIDQAVRQFEHFGVSQAEVTREINSLRTRYEEGVKSASTRNTVGLAGELISEVNDRKVSNSPANALDIFNRAIEGLTAETVSEVAKTYFTGEGPILTLTSPQPIADGKPDEALLAAYQSSLKTAVAPVPANEIKKWAYTDFGKPGKVVRTSKPDRLGATTYEFANGVKLTLKHVDFNKQQIAIGVLTGIGDRNFSPDKINPLLTGLGGVSSGGLGKMTTDETQRAFNGKVVSAGFSSLGQRFLLSGGTRPEDLQLEMQYLTATLTDPGLRSADFNKAMIQNRIYWPLIRSTPDSVYAFETSTLLSGNDQRRAKVPPEVTDTWRLEPMRDDIRRMISQGPIHIVMTGDFVPAEAVKAVASTFGALPPRPAYNAPASNADRRSVAEPTPEPRVFTHDGLKNQSLGTVTWQTIDGIGPNIPMARQLQVLRSVFQLRVNDIIREKEGLAYSPGVRDEFSQDYEGYGMVSAQASLEPQKLPAFYDAIDRIVKDLQDRPVSQDELDRARGPMIEHTLQNRKTNVGWYGLILSSVYDPSAMPYVLGDIQDYQAVTPAKLQQLARQYLTSTKAIRISVIPSDKATGTTTLANGQ